MAGDTRVRSERRGMNPHEFRVLAVLIPLTVFVAIASGTAGFLGKSAWLVAVPLSFIALNLLPVILQRKSQAMQWWVALAGCVMWAVFHRRAIGIAGLLAWVWIAFAVMNVAAALVLEWREAMACSGRLGIAWRIFLIVGLHGVAVAVGWNWGWPWAVCAAASIAATWGWAVFRPGCQWLGPVYRTTDDDKPLITIDDGPDPADTPVLLELLDLHQAKAIFFMIGEKVRAHPGLAREVIRRGHEIGNHTLTHPQASFWGAGPARTRREIADCQAIIEEITGIRPRWFRAPVGHRNLFTHPIATTLGLRVMAWNRRGYDAIGKDAATVLARILPDLTGGDIVLVHEATPIAAAVLSGVLERAYPIELERGIHSASSLKPGRAE